MRIAVLTAGLTESYQITIRDGIKREADNRGIDVWFFPGMPSGFGPGDGEGSRSLLPMLNPDNFDGVLVSTASYSSFMDTEDLKKFCLQFRPLPVVSVGIELNGIPSVSVDPKSGMRELLDHLTSDHHFQNFLFIAGPRQNKESATRKDFFIEYITEKKLPSEPERIIHGDFMAESVAPLLENVFTKDFPLPIEAVVVANDTMALGAIKFFLNRGLTVPEDIRITGFDNVAESKNSFPPLTTIRQPLFEMGREALNMLLSVIRGEMCENKIFPTSLVIRESCGCLPLSLQTPLSGVKNQQAESIENENLKEILTEKLKERNLFPGKEQEKKLYDLVENLKKDRENFLSLFSLSVKNDVIAKRPLTIWREAIALLQIYSKEDQRTISILDSARNFINRYLFLAENFERDVKEERRKLASDVGIHLVATTGTESIISLLRRSLPPLHKGLFLIAIFEDNQYSRPFFFHDGSEKEGTEYSEILYKTSSIFPPPLQKYSTSNFIISALNFNEERLGYLVMEEAPEILSVYYTFTWQLSNSLKINALTKAQENYTITLEKEVEERTKELVRSNEILKEEIENRKAAEKKALTSEMKFRTILETIPFPLAICRISDGTVLYRNKPFCTFTETDGTDQLSAKDLFLFEKEYQKLIPKLSPPNDIQAGESVLITHNKSERHCLLSTGLIRYEEEASFILGIHDLTEKRALEKEILDVSDRERRRIGQDLHDDLGQKLAGIAVLSRVLESKLNREKSPFAEEAEEIARYTEESIVQTKNLARGLYPVVLKQQGLPASLKELTELVESQFGIDCQLIFDPKIKEHPFSPEIFIQLYRITQEAVSNAARHSRGDEITVRLSDKEEETVISVSDNGQGMDLPMEIPKGLGLTTMEYRAGLIGAELEIESTPGKGTIVSCRILKKTDSKKEEKIQYV